MDFACGSSTGKNVFDQAPRKLGKLDGINDEDVEGACPGEEDIESELISLRTTLSPGSGINLVYVMTELTKEYFKLQLLISNVQMKLKE